MKSTLTRFYFFIFPEFPASTRRSMDILKDYKPELSSWIIPNEVS